MKQSRKSLALLLILLFLVASCASQVGTSQPSAKPSAKEIAYKTLLTGKQTYEAVFTMLATLDKQGKLSATAKAQAIRLGNIYLAAHNQAVDDLLAGREPAMGAVRAALDAFINYAATVKGGK